MNNIVDLGEFIEEKRRIKFTINGHTYDFEFMESQVDEVLRVLADPYANTVDAYRKSVTDFLLNRVPEGIKEQLRADLATVPYKTGGNRLSILNLHAAVQGLFLKKNESGDDLKAEVGQSGS